MIIRRQEHGIKAVTVNLTLSPPLLARIKREATARGISKSMRVVALLELAWSVEEAMGQHGATPPPVPLAEAESPDEEGAA